jgi:hypothetical protein
LAAPSADLDARIGEITSMLKTFELSSWQPAPVVVDGRVHVETERGFSFDYPAGWTIYYPQDVSMSDAAVVTVASGPLEPPCPDDTCQGFTTPAETVAIEFRIGSMPGGPDWSTATTMVGGQPAFRQDWGPQNATRAEEGHTWSVRLGESEILGIGASLRGPGLAVRHGRHPRQRSDHTLGTPSLQGDVAVTSHRRQGWRLGPCR